MAYARVGIIGYGRLGQRIAKNISPLKPLIRDTRTLATTCDNAISNVANNDPVNYAANNSEVVTYSDIIILAVKPDKMREVCAEIRAAIADYHIVISVAARISVSDISTWLGTERVIRCMPNIDTAQGLVPYFTCMTASNLVTTALSCVFHGKHMQCLNEKDLNVSTIVGSCSPAILAWMVREFQAFACAHIDPAMSAEIITEAFKSTARLLDTMSPEEIIATVASPNGLTLRILDSLEDNGAASTLNWSLKDSLSIMNA